MITINLTDGSTIDLTINASDIVASLAKDTALAAQVGAEAAESGAQQAELAAQTSEQNAANSAEEAKSYADSASTSRTNAQAYANSASSSKTAASTSATAAKTSETNSSDSEVNAKASETSCANILAQCKEQIAKITGTAKYVGSVDNYSDLTGKTNNTGDVWNIVNEDKTNGIKAGDNVIWNGKSWDNLSGFIDLSNYPTNSDVSNVLISAIATDNTITFTAKDGTTSQISVDNVGSATKATKDGSDNTADDRGYFYYTCS